MIARQKEIIAKLKASGHDAKWAEQLLEHFKVLSVHIRDASLGNLSTRSG